MFFQNGVYRQLQPDQERSIHMAFKFMKKISPEYVIEHAIKDVKTSGMEGLKPYLTEKAEKRVDTIKLVSSGVDLFTGGSMASLLLNKLSDCDWHVIDITKGFESAKGIVGFSFENGEETVTGTSFHMHIAAPLLTFASFVLLENDKKLGFSRIFCGMAPMLVYAAVYVLMAVVIGYGNGGWTDFYSFNRNGMWYVTLVMMTSVTFVLCASTRLLHNHILSHRNKRASVAVLPGAASFGK